MFQDQESTDLIQSDGNTHMEWPSLRKLGECLIKEMTFKVFCNVMNLGKGSMVYKACHRIIISMMGMSVIQKNVWYDSRWSLWQQRWGTTGGWIHTDSLRASREASKLSGEVGRASWRSFQMKTLEVGRAAQSYCFWTKVPVTIKLCEFLLFILKTSFFTVKMSIFNSFL